LIEVPINRPLGQRAGEDAEKSLCTQGVCP